MSYDKNGKPFTVGGLCLLKINLQLHSIGYLEAQRALLCVGYSVQRYLRVNE